MPQPQTARETALAAAVRTIEQAAAASGWDGPVRVFALAETALAPELAPTPDLPQGHLTPVEQDGLPAAETLNGLLARLAWPAAVAGVAIVVEQFLLSDDAASPSPPEPHTAPSREDVRIAAGVLRSGESWCVLRLRTADSPAMRLQGADLVPDLVLQLQATLRPEDGP